MGGSFEVIHSLKAIYVLDWWDSMNTRFDEEEEKKRLEEAFPKYSWTLENVQGSIHDEFTL